MKGSFTPRLLVGIMLLSVAARIGSALIQGDTVVVLPGISDQVSYDALARRVLGGYGFSFARDWWPATRAGEPTAHWSYLYSLYLAGVYAIVGPHPFAARLIQALLVGILQPLLTWRIARRVCGPRVGLMAAGLTAIYGYFVYYSGALMTEPFTILAVLWILDLATAMAASPALCLRIFPSGRLQFRESVGPWLLFGLALGLAVLLRQVVVLFIPVLLAWMVWAISRRRWTGSRTPGVSSRLSLLVGPLISLAVLAALILPWTVRNAYAFGRLVPLNTNAGYAFFWANHPIHGTDFVSILPDGTYQSLIPPELRDLNEAALDAALLERGVSFVTQDIGRYLLLSVSRVRDYFMFWPSADSAPLSNLVRVLSLGLYLPFMVYGVFLATARSEQYVVDGQRPSVILLCLFVVIYSLVHLLSWALIRYRLPVDAILMIFAGLAVVRIGRRWLGADHVHACASDQKV